MDHLSDSSIQRGYSHLLTRWPIRAQGYSDVAGLTSVWTKVGYRATASSGVGNHLAGRRVGTATDGWRSDGA